MGDDLERLRLAICHDVPKGSGPPVGLLLFQLGSRVAGDWARSDRSKKRILPNHFIGKPRSPERTSDLSKNTLQK